MRQRDLDTFAEQLRSRGVAPRYVRRAVAEVADHIDDLVDDAQRQGQSRVQAETYARRQIGDLATIADEIAERPELLAWTSRYPRIASICLPLMYCLLLPTAPIFAGVARAPLIARWGASAMLGAAMTAMTFLVLQVSILLA